MKKFILFFVFMGLSTPFAMAAEDGDPSWKTCESQEAGVTFKCDPAWKLHRLGRSLKVIISENPKVEMDVAESDMKLRFTSELNREALESFGRYEPGFHVERASVCGRETVKVNGYLKGNPNVRVSDFYLVDHLRIHMVRFTLDPKESWDDNAALIKDIVDQFAFIKPKQNIKLITKETDEKCEDLVSETTP